MVVTTFKQHKSKWCECQLCPLHEVRGKVVLARGQLPCDVLFIGEAPGPSEDVIGQPFIGPAGKLLDQMINNAGFLGADLRLAFTNIVACIPKDENEDKFAEPDKASIKACRGRLEEFVRNLAKPRAIIRVGRLSTKYVDESLFPGAELYDIVHPAYILRADISQKGLAIKTCEVTLSDIADSFIPF